MTKKLQNMPNLSLKRRKRSKGAGGVYGSADQYEFITLVVEEAYKAGAKQVEVQWSYQPVTRLNYKKMTLKQLSKFPKWKEEKLKYQLEKLPACIHILSDDPDGLKGINYEKMAKPR